MAAQPDIAVVVAVAAPLDTELESVRRPAKVEHHKRASPAHFEAAPVGQVGQMGQAEQALATAQAFVVLEPGKAAAPVVAQRAVAQQVFAAARSGARPGTEA